MRSFVAALLLALIPVSGQSMPQKQVYQVIGKILRSDGSPFPGVTPIVFLQGAVTPYSNQAPVGRDGAFKLKGIPEGTYTMIAAVPRMGETRKTIEVGKSFADSKGRVSVTIKFSQTDPVERRSRVSTAELGIPEKAEREFIRADEFLLRQDIKGAIEHLKKAVEIAPQYSIAWNKLGTIAYQTHQYRQAEEYFRKSLQTDPDAYPPLVNLGGTLLSLQQYEDSLQYNQAAVKAMPGDALAHSQLGQSYFHLGRLDDAEMHLKRAKALDPGHFSFPQLFLAEIFFRQNQLKAVIAELEEFLKLHPDSDWAPRIRETLKAAQARLTTPP